MNDLERQEEVRLSWGPGWSRGQKRGRTQEIRAYLESFILGGS